MNRLKRKYIIFMHRHFKRYRLRKICEALDIVPYPWQRAFALGKTDILNAPEGRATGKTTAVLLRLLMTYPGDTVNVMQILKADPDFRTDIKLRVIWYDREYRRMLNACAAKMPVQVLHIYMFYDGYTRRV